MSDGSPPRKDKEPAKPTWTERAIPATVKPEPPPQPFDPGDTNALIPAADTVVKAAYGRTGMLPVRPVMNRGDGGTDALVIQKGAKQTRVLNFRVEGIHWRAGFAPEVGQTPLGQYVQDLIPPDREIQTGTGFVFRPVEADLESVLRDIVPISLLKLEEEMFGRTRELGRAYLYYIPHANGATAGMVAWYTLHPLGKAHLVYLQTEIKRADVRILDEMYKTFKASFVARGQAPSTTRPVSFWQELADATTTVEVTLRQSALGRGEVKQRVMDARNQVEDKLYHGINKNLGRVGDLGLKVFVELPQVALARVVRVGGRWLVRAINAADRLIAPKKPDETDFFG